MDYQIGKRIKAVYGNYKNIDMSMENGECYKKRLRTLNLHKSVQEYYTNEYPLVEERTKNVAILHKRKNES